MSRSSTIGSGIWSLTKAAGNMLVTASTISVVNQAMVDHPEAIDNARYLLRDSANSEDYRDGVIDMTMRTIGLSTVYRSTFVEAISR